jgi:beta-ribofuranosylaminobenzene 5'-phosphate synthase
MQVRVSAGGRLHFGFTNLSLANDRLYGSLGVALDEPRVTVTAEPADELDCDDPLARSHTAAVVDSLGVPGARVRVDADLPRHVGLGSGTQYALATLTAIARAYDLDPRVREHAPALGRGGRSGVGVAAFESGGLVLDAGHPAGRFTTERPPPGAWTVPDVVTRTEVPDDWRFLVVVPDLPSGRNGEDEDASMRAVVERADPDVADRIAGLVLRRALPAVADADHVAFGRAVEAIGRLNGRWYADEQGGVYRPPVGALVEDLGDSQAVTGVGQSSWGPAVYGVTTAAYVEAARSAGRAALEELGVDGTVRVVAAATEGARVDPVSANGEAAQGRTGRRN